MDKKFVLESDKETTSENTTYTLFVRRQPSKEELDLIHQSIEDDLGPLRESYHNNRLVNEELAAQLKVR